MSSASGGYGDSISGVLGKRLDSEEETCISSGHWSVQDGNEGNWGPSNLLA